MARPSPLSRPGPLLTQRLGPPLTSGDVPYDPTDTGMTADDVQEAIDELYDLITGGGASAEWPRPLMAFDPEDDHWYVVVDGDGTAVMVPAP